MTTQEFVDPDGGRLDHHKIVLNKPYGEHIPLTCVNHPELTWSTKNISPIGCRRIFFDLMNETPGRDECSCPISDLRPAP